MYPSAFIRWDERHVKRKKNAVPRCTYPRPPETPIAGKDKREKKGKLFHLTEGIRRKGRREEIRGQTRVRTRGQTRKQKVRQKMTRETTRLHRKSLGQL
jgi:hypothetical protein